MYNLFFNFHLRLSYHLKQLNYLDFGLLRGKLKRIENMEYLLYLCAYILKGYDTLSF